MKDYILLLPIIFIFHDMEEIIGFGRFFKKNPDLFERFPRVTAAYKDFNAAGFALAVYEEFIPFFGVSLLAYYFPNDIFYGLWLGIFLSLAAHLLVHIGHALYIRKYIPCVATSIICLPISVAIIYKCAKLIALNAVTIACIPLAFVLMMANLKFAHFLMHWFNKR